MSGTPAVVESGYNIDLLGVPRLDLVLHARADMRAFDFEHIREIDDGLQLAHSIVDPAPIVVTVVHSRCLQWDDSVQFDQHMAAATDMFLSLIDIGLREQALQFSKQLEHRAESASDLSSRKQ